MAGISPPFSFINMGNPSKFTEADRFSVAPMIDVTNRTFRRMARLLTKRAMLYTEMIAAQAITHGKEHLIEQDPNNENPCTLQLGGSDPKVLAQACKIALNFGYSAINLNAGCPSDKVQSGSFGAILMKTPEVITDCLKAMQDAVDIPVTVKTRIGVDDLDDFEYTKKIVQSVYITGSRHIILHARKAWLNGLSPKFAFFLQEFQKFAGGNRLFAKILAFCIQCSTHKVRHRHAWNFRRSLKRHKDALVRTVLRRQSQQVFTIKDYRAFCNLILRVTHKYIAQCAFTRAIGSH